MRPEAKNPEEARGKEKNWVEITIRHGGQTISDSWNIHHKIRKVLDDALGKFKELYGLVPPPNAEVYLTYGNIRLEPEQSLQDYAIPDKAVLDLVFHPRAG